MLSSLSKLSNSRDPLLFDIRLKSTDHDVLLLKGKENEASSVLLAGTIVLSVLEPIQIRSLSLRLIGKVRLNIPTTYCINGVNTKKYVKYEKMIFSYNWDEFNMDDFFDNLYGNYGKMKLNNSGRLSPSTISSNLNTNSTNNGNSDGLLNSNISSIPTRSKSSSSLFSLGNTSTYHTLLQGNYEFPFSTVLPGSLIESVEGLPNASVIYKLESVLERTKGPDINCQKPLRIVRTLSPDAVELSETVAAENSWPNKMEYTLSIPAKSIAIGSATPVYIVLVPLLKNLKLGHIKISLLETSQYLGPFGGVVNQERIVTKLKLKDPLGHISLLKKQREGNGNNDDLGPIDFQDRWEIDTIINVPPSLSKCTQDCDIFNNIRVRHKLKFNISLINPDGHISELRASLPIQLFISPFVTVGVKNTKTVEMEQDRKVNSKVNYNNDGNTSSNANTSFSSETFFLNNKETNTDEDEDVIFANATSEVELHAGTLENNFFATTAISELMTPPNYGKHVYDRLWSDIPASQNSLSLEPELNTCNPVSNSSPDVCNDPHDVNNLQENFTELNLLRDTQVTPVYLSSTNPFRDSQFPTFATSESDPQCLDEGLQSLPLTPAFDHISRASSFSNLRQESTASLRKVFEMAELSRLPSYDKAVHSDIIEDDLPPTYPHNEEQSEHLSQERNNMLRSVNKFSLEKPQSLRHRSSSFLSVVSRQRSLSRSSNNSNTSLNLMARNNTGGSLSVPQNNSNSTTSLNKLSSSGRKASFNMTPIPLPVIRQDCVEENNLTSYPLQRNDAINSSKSRQRSTSFPVFVGMFSKKD
ncbi:arrestin family protein PWA37_004171 [Arxiozyma heterogenica]|uniref:Arrestin C-terminal-like domain-containing protein n=1 Tax=Arxiozyma heterogenica TaxID=278026 RepID=A0AAN8A6S5_9SACH|nr:hypothetical protein RI543_003187 [Kazachstania heterogenica]